MQYDEMLTYISSLRKRELATVVNLLVRDERVPHVALVEALQAMQEQLNDALTSPAGGLHE